MIRKICLVSYCLVLAVAAMTATAADQAVGSQPEAEWPCWRGPAGGGSQPDFQGELIADPAKARRVWKSEYVPKVQDGGYSSPVVADGKVYVYYYVGDGKLTDQKAYDKLRKGRHYQTEAQRKALSSPAADEVVLCLDSATGKTLWKQTYASSGLNQQGSNKVGGHFTPAVADGKVFVLGCSGILYCVDAATGEPKWQTPLTAFKRLREIRDRCVARKEMPPFSRGRGTLPCSAPAVADGVVCVSDHGGHVGFDVETGKKLWRVPGSCSWDASPLVWRHDGKAYFVGVGNLIEAGTGKEMWKLRAAHRSGTPALEGNLLVFGGGGRRDEKQGASGWRISPEKAEKLWQLDPEYTVSGNHTGPGIHQGTAYLHCGAAFGKNKGCVLAVDAATGEELARHNDIWYVKLTTSVTGMANRIFIIQCNGRFRIFGAGKDFKELVADPEDRRGMKSGADWSGIYGNSTTPALVDGLMYFRGTDAVYCYDLRQATTAGQASVGPAEAPGTR